MHPTQYEAPSSERQRHEDQGAEGSWGGGVHLLSWLRSLGELGSVVSFPRRVRGRAPATNAFWAYFRASEAF